MAATQAARAAPLDADGPLEVLQHGGLQSSNSAPPTDQRRTIEAERRAFLEDVRDIGRRGRHAGARLERAASEADPFRIGAEAATFVFTADRLRKAIDDAIRYDGPARETFAIAAAEFRAARGEAVTTPGPAMKQRETWRPVAYKLSAKATAERARLQKAHPTQWAAGEAAELTRRGAPPEFRDWSQIERDAFFSAAASIAEHRLRERAIDERAR